MSTDGKAAPKIGGWLYIPAIHIWLILLSQANDSLNSIIVFYKVYTMNGEMTPYGILFFSVTPAIALTLFVGSILTVRLFHKKKAIAIVAILILVWSSFILDIIVNILTLNISLTNLNVRYLLLKLFVLLFIILYSYAFKSSKRAKATFIN